MERTWPVGGTHSHCPWWRAGSVRPGELEVSVERRLQEWRAGPWHAVVTMAAHRTYSVGDQKAWKHLCPSKNVVNSVFQKVSLADTEDGREGT